MYVHLVSICFCAFVSYSLASSQFHRQTQIRLSRTAARGLTSSDMIASSDESTMAFSSRSLPSCAALIGRSFGCGLHSTLVYGRRFNLQPMAALQCWQSRVATLTTITTINHATWLFVVSDDTYCGRWRRRMASFLDTIDALAVHCCCDTFLGRRRHEGYYFNMKNNQPCDFYIVVSVYVHAFWCRFAAALPSLTHLHRLNFDDKCKIRRAA
jgi:hypothetical protein